MAWWTTWIVGPGRAGVCSVDYTRAGPRRDAVWWPTDADTRIELDLVEPLEAFRIAANAPAEVMARPEDVYARHARHGRPRSTST